MIEFRNRYSTVKLVLDCNVNNYQDIPDNIIDIINEVCDSNNYYWRITQHKYNNVPIIPASLLEMKRYSEQEFPDIDTSKFNIDENGNVLRGNKNE